MHKLTNLEDLNQLHQKILSLVEISSSKELTTYLELLIKSKDNLILSEIIKVSFSLLEKALILTKDKLLLDNLCEFILENIEGINVTQYFRMILILEQSTEMFDLLINSSTIENFMKIVSSDNDVRILKNSSIILTNFYEKFVQFTNINELSFFLESEHIFFRSAYLILLYKQISLELHDSSGTLSPKQLERTCSYISVISERTLDYHYLVRSKAIGVISYLFKDRYIPKNIRKNVLEAVNQRVLDKTQMVKKKAIACLSNALLYHPFLLNSGSLEIKEDEKQTEYYKDLLEFRKQILITLKNIKFLIKEDQKSDIDEILNFLKLAYFYGIKETISTYEDLFIYTQNNYEMIDKITNSFMELFAQIKNKIIEFFFEFEPSPHLQLIIQMISKRKYFNNETFTMVFKEIKEKRSFSHSKKGMFFLSCTAKYLSLDVENILDIISYISDELFKSKNHSELINNVQLYRFTLNLVLNYKDKTLNKEIVNKLIKTFVKMNFYDPEINKKIVKLCFESGKEYEANVSLLLKFLNTKNTNKLKLINSVGCIVEEQGKLIDLLEAKVKKLKNNSKNDDLKEATKKIRDSLKLNDELRKSLNSGIKERRKSITLSRLSFHGKLSDVLETEKVLNKVMNKPEDEILDILFYVKEREILYSKDALLNPYMDMIVKGCKDNDLEIVNVSYLSLLKCMSISSSFFEENIDLFFSGLKHSDKRVRNNCVITTRDFFLNYNFLLEKRCNLLFETLNDSDLLVKKHAIFIIFDLLLKNIIKVKQGSLLLSELMIDMEEEIRRISYYLFNKLIKDNSSVHISIVANIFYESLIFAEKTKLKELMQIFFTLLPDKVKEVCFVKLLRNKEYDKEIVKFYLEKANFSEKFVEEMQVYEEFGAIVN